jgi:hypothetical protein
MAHLGVRDHYSPTSFLALTKEPSVKNAKALDVKAEF